MKTHLHNNMKKFFVLGMLAIMVIACPQQTHAQNNVGINTTSPDASAALDVRSGSGLNQGILPTFVDLATATFPSPGPATGLLVHNTNTAYGQGTGIYQNIGTPAAPIWLKQITKNDAWGLLGNTGTTQPSAPGTYGTSTIVGNYFGNTDNKDIVVGINGIEQARFFKSGQFNIGSANIGAKFEVHQTSDNSVMRFYNYGNSLDIDFRRPSGTQSSPIQTGATAVVGRMNGQGYDGSTFRDIGSIRFVTTSTTTSTSSPGKIIFATTKTGSTSTTDAVIIDETSNVTVSNLATGTKPIYADASGTLINNDLSIRANTATPGTGTWTVPAGVYQIHVYLWGGGGGSANDATFLDGGSGGGGGFVTGILNVVPGESLTITIGAGGASVANGNHGKGGKGTSIKRGSTFLAIAGGGGGGSYTSSTFPGYYGGQTFGTTTIDGSDGSASTSGAGGSNYFSGLFLFGSQGAGYRGSTTTGVYNFPFGDEETAYGQTGTYGRGGRRNTGDAGTAGFIFIKY